MKKLFILCVSLFITGLTFSQTVFMENESWDAVKDKAAKEKRMIFMDCYTSWCGPCKGLAQNVFPQKKVGDFLNSHFVCCKYDMEKGEGIMLYKKYKSDIPGFPTMLVINPADESIVHKVVGYTEPDALIVALQDGLDGKTLTVFQKRYDAGERSLELMQDYCKALDVAYDQDTKERVIREYIESMPLDSLKSKELFDMYLPYLKDAYSPQYEYVVKHLDDYQYKLKMNRYDIETRLQRTMSDAVREIVNITLNNTCADTLAMMREKEKVLKKLLQSASVKGFNELYAKLAVNDIRMKGDIVALDAMLEADKTLRATRDEYSFRPDMYKYIIEFANNKTQKEVIRKYLAIIQERQSMDDEKSNGKITLFTSNNYDILAIGYYRLGDKKRSEECAKEFDERYKIKLVDMKEMFKDEKVKAQIDQEYIQTVNELYAKIGLEQK
ncbi:MULTISPECIES: thioredoxin family protein [Butyricimonas]|uniref:thioredoxin family protein n=1 Tax=Butyricimonas TaxID=574697 RepID=UPI001D096DD1|nr:thioredoxin family protein [Butyricimonas synergistica]MCB6974014.1 thioredoxin family protein [Butyricimonas synergistica]MCG4520924.1 thioredoxin family protein [Butyricimonas sp. DFI.6.44]